jgi:hypothetical protein
MLRPAALLFCAALATGFAADGATKAPTLPGDDQIAAAVAQAQDTLAQGRPASVAIDGRLFSVTRSAGGRIALVPAYGAPIQLTTVSANGTLTITAITANGKTRPVQLVVASKTPNKKKTDDEEVLAGGSGDVGTLPAAPINTGTGSTGGGTVVPPIVVQPPASPR